jgi:hypothetical protein
MIVLQLLAAVPAKHFIFLGLGMIALFDAAKLVCQPDDTISDQIGRWATGNPWLPCLVSAIAGGLLAHWFRL